MALVPAAKNGRGREGCSLKKSRRKKKDVPTPASPSKSREGKKESAASAPSCEETKKRTHLKSWDQKYFQEKGETFSVPENGKTESYKGVQLRKKEEEKIGPRSTSGTRAPASSGPQILREEGV